MRVRTLITGGAGFVGVNLGDHLARAGDEVVVLDDLSRRGVRENLRWLCAEHGDRIRLEVGDIRDAERVRRATAGVDRVFHFAAQVAVTTSLDDPSHDVGVNLLGTVTLLEQLRRLPSPPPVVFTSTNKVYGELADVLLERRGRRYEPLSRQLRAHGVSEAQPLSFCSPYGCSKGAADQYVLDYAKTYGLRSVVFRMSCIYGPHQCGNEDQGWIAHFVRQAIEDGPLTIYGDGAQVRDALFVGDLVRAMTAAMDCIDDVAGRAFNIGGGPANTVSLLELVDRIAVLQGRRPEVDFGPWRRGDQPWYVSDTRAFQAATGWRPRVGVDEGLARLHEWLTEASTTGRLTVATGG